MKILEKTAERLVIQNGDSSGSPELVWVALWVNILATFCFVEISKSSVSQDHAPFVISFAIGWLLIHFLFPVDRKENSSEYWFAVAFGSIPFLGVSLLSLAAIPLLLSELLLPHHVILTLDKNEDLFTIKSKFLYWYLKNQYPLHELTGAMRSTTSVYGGSMIIALVPIVQLARTRRRDRKTLQRDLPFCEKDAKSVVYLINRFLLESLS